MISKIFWPINVIPESVVGADRRSRFPKGIPKGREGAFTLRIELHGGLYGFGERELSGFQLRHNYAQNIWSKCERRAEVLAIPFDDNHYPTRRPTKRYNDRASPARQETDQRMSALVIPAERSKRSSALDRRSPFPKSIMRLITVPAVLHREETPRTGGLAENPPSCTFSSGLSKNATIPTTNSAARSCQCSMSAK